MDTRERLDGLIFKEMVEWMDVWVDGWPWGHRWMGLEVGWLVNSLVCGV